MFELDPAGNLTVLHSFSGADGSWPRAGLIRDGAGDLSGTTSTGGSLNGGTVFQLSSIGRFTTLHNFGSGTEGYFASSSLLLQAGILYGTTYLGGLNGFGTVFQVDARTAQETVIHNFLGGAEGANPEAALVPDGQGNLYGTTFYYGAVGGGTLFQLDPAANLTTLHAFGGGPAAAPIRDPRGNLYGTTYSGGRHCAGTVWVVAP